MLRGVTSFSEILGLFPNPEKCTCFFGNVPIEVQESTLKATGFFKGTLPVTYLGLPLLSSKLNMRDCEALVMRLCKQIDLWTNTFLKHAGRVQLIKSVLFGIQGY